MKFLLISLLVILSASCSTHIEEKGYALIESPTKSKIFKSFSQLKDKRAYYKDEYTGNFTYYFSPMIISDDQVDVPIVTCTAYRLVGKELVRYEDNIRRCSYRTEKRNYAIEPEYIFENFDENSIPIEKAKKVVYAWYINNSNKNNYIDTVYINNDGGLSVSLSGGASSGMTESAIEVRPDEFEFTYDENQVFICS